MPHLPGDPHDAGGAHERRELAAGRGAEIGIRVNPDVDAKTHAKISTGRADNKFGIDISRAREIFAKAAATPGIKPVSVAVHIGSQLTDLTPLRAAYTSVAELVGVLRADGHDIDSIDLGGGIGIRYKDEAPPSFAEYAAIVQETTGNLGCRLFVEPGRSLVGNAGILVTRVIYDKQGQARRFVIVDAAMNDLVRPAMYDAYHGIRTVRKTAPGRPKRPRTSLDQSARPAIPLLAPAVYRHFSRMICSRSTPPAPTAP